MRGFTMMPKSDLFPVVGIVGCGLIGISWAGLFLAGGHDVIAWDPSAEARDHFSGEVARVVKQLDVIGRSGQLAKGHLSVVDDVSDVASAATLIQENAPENVALKRALYAGIESVATEQLVICSSTSSLVWSELSLGMKRPERLITAHPFNPPHLMPLVEIFGPDTALVSCVVEFYRTLGRVPVVLKKEAVGHIANRLASALWREAVNIVAEGIADVPEVDAALVNGPGLRWSVIGAHMAYHLGGGSGGIDHYLRHLGPSQERRWATLGTPSLTPEVCSRLIEGIRKESRGLSVADLEVLRDRDLIAALKARQEVGQ
jgi:3-hydroxyacyl-CoA dehydrogenase